MFFISMRYSIFVTHPPWFQDEVCQFLGSILSMSAGPSEHSATDVAPVDPRRKRKRKVGQLMGVNPVDSNLPASLGFDATDSAVSIAWFLWWSIQLLGFTHVLELEMQGTYWTEVK